MRGIPQSLSCALVPNRGSLPFPFLPAIHDRLSGTRFGLGTALLPVGADRAALQVSVGTAAVAGRRVSAVGRACERRARARCEGGGVCAGTVRANWGLARWGICARGYGCPRCPAPPRRRGGAVTR